MVKRGYFFGQVGGNGGQSGGVDQFSRFAGSYPRHGWLKVGVSFCPLLRRGPVRPKNVLGKKKKTVCVLGMGCGRLASASELHSRQLGERGNQCVKNRW